MDRVENEEVVELGAVTAETKGGVVGIADTDNGLQLNGAGLTDD